MHKRPNTMEIVDADEEKLIEVHKHPFGIVILYIQVAVAMVLAIGLGAFILPSLVEDIENALLYGGVFAGLAIIAAFAVVLFSSLIYRQNRIVVTDRNVTQVLQYGLFNRKISQLNIVNVEDVTSIQPGFFSTMFNFGTLKIETAGEQKNFDFTYCPNSGVVAKIILDARERMLGQAEGSTGEYSNSQKTKNNKSSVKNLGAEVVDHALDR